MRPPTVKRMARHERRRRKGVVEIVHDDGGFDDDVSVVDERRHHAVRVELEIGGFELITIQGQQVAFPFQSFFRQGQSRLLSADGCSPMIKSKHRFTSL
jgi:hypothetical protein